MPLDLMSSKIKQGPKTNQRLTLGCGFSKQGPRKDLQEKINACAMLPTRKINEGKRKHCELVGCPFFSRDDQWRKEKSNHELSPLSCTE
jgi:hypothetical protein